MTRFLSVTLVCLVPFGHGHAGDGSVSGVIVEDESGHAVAARLYIESKAGEFFHAESADESGKSATYRKQRGEISKEIHTCLTGHAFSVKLPAGKYTLTAERGHEYLTESIEIDVSDDAEVEVELRLKRWINMNERGWFSGDTHIHREPGEMEVLMKAEDLNVTFPLTGWVTDTVMSPANPDDNKVKIAEDGVKPQGVSTNIDFNRVMWSMNTEYEIFSVEGKKHMLGAFFVLNHKKPIEATVPPVGPVFESMTKAGALIEMDKHNWPWTLMLPTVSDTNMLFELSNNHVWRTGFGITDWLPENLGEYMEIEPGPGGTSYGEEGWIDSGLQTYYALLNCGFKLKPTAGTGAGVHPVPLGFSRVYVKPTDGEFSYDNWVDGLREGRSFVTTGPMLAITFSEHQPGTVLDDDAVGELEDSKVDVVGRVESAYELERLEIVVNGVATPVEIDGPIGSGAPHSAFVRESVELEGESWVAFRAYARTPEGRIRFAHTAPVWVDARGESLLPTLSEANYLRNRMAEEVERNKDVISDEALEEFEEAYEFYDELRDKAAKRAR